MTKKKNLPKTYQKNAITFHVFFLKEKSHVSWFSYGNQHLGKTSKYHNFCQWTPEVPRPQPSQSLKVMHLKGPFSGAKMLALREGN